MDFPAIRNNPLDSDDWQIRSAKVPSSFSFTLDGVQHYIVRQGCNIRTEITLMRQGPIQTYRIARMEQIGDLYRCLMTGSKGAALMFYLSHEDVCANLRIANEMAYTIQCPLIC